MQKNKTLIAVAIFIVLLLIVIFTHEDPYQQPEAKNLPTLPKLQVDQINKVELVNKAEAITFEKEGDAWYSSKPARYKIDETFGSLVVEKLGDIELDRPVSESAEKHNQFEVDEEGTRVKAFVGDAEALSLIVGKNTPDYRGTFVRLPDSDVVYATKKVISSMLKKSIKDWRDKSILGKFEVPNVTSLDITRGKEKMTFAKGDVEVVEKSDGDGSDIVTSKEGWILKDYPEFTVDKTRLEGSIRMLSTMKWSDVIDLPKSLSDYGLDKPAASLEIGMKEGEAKTLLVGKLNAEDNVGWVSVVGDARVFKIQKYQYDKLLKDKSYYKGDSKADVKVPPSK